MLLRLLRFVLFASYFSFICRTPIKVNKLKAKTGDQIANTIGILSVLPKANEKSLK